MIGCVFQVKATMNIFLSNADSILLALLDDRSNHRADHILQHGGLYCDVIFPLLELGLYSNVNAEKELC